jgi:hypothetical protein
VLQATDGNAKLRELYAVLSAEETAEFLRLALQTVRNMTSRWELPFIKTGARGAGPTTSVYKIGYRMIDLITWQEMDEDERTVMKHRLMRKYPRNHEVRPIVARI